MVPCFLWGDAMRMKKAVLYITILTGIVVAIIFRLWLVENSFGKSPDKDITEAVIGEQESEKSGIIEADTDINESESIRNDKKDTDTDELEDGLKDIAEDTKMDVTTKDKAAEFVSKMPLADKVWQMFVVTAEQLSGTGTDPVDETSIVEGIKKRPVGGVIYFAHNLTGEEQTKKLLKVTGDNYEAITGLKMLLCIDEEGGSTARIGNNENFDVKKIPPMAEIKTREEAYKAGETIGTYLSEYGFNVDFAPDADVITNPANVIIGDRSFGTDPEVVGNFAVSYSDGLHSKKVYSCFKHFPGHGSTEADTHAGYAYTNKTYEELKESELKPFEKAGENGVDFIMVAHISVPNVIGDDTPCTLSYKMITEILREEMKYDGIVITDAMNMGAITTSYDNNDACIQAILAGNDIILMPLDPDSLHEAVLKAVEEGIIKEELIDKAVTRIIRAKLGL